MRIDLPSDYFNRQFIGLNSNMLLDDTERNGSYPPYNIVQLDNNTFKIEVAVSGFDKNQLSVVVKDGKLVVESNFENEVDTDNTRRNSNNTQYKDSMRGKPYYWHRGIAMRKFRLVFKLMETVVVNKSKLENGILTIDLVNILPESMKPKTIAIE